MSALLARLGGAVVGVTAIVAPLCALGLYVRMMGQRLDLDGSLARIAAAVLLVGLLVLVARYCALLWFSFLAHLESGPADGSEPAPFVSVVVPAYNEERVIDAAIRSLTALDYPHYEIVVVDDGSNDSTYREALRQADRAEGVEVRVVSQPNGGKARALNRGIESAVGEYVLCVDGDSVLAPGSLRAAMRHFRDPHLGAVAGNVKVANRVNLLTWFQSLEYVEGLNLVRRAFAFFRAVNIVPGPLGIFRKAAIRSVGGYPADTFAEDCDLTLALLARGWRITYEPQAIAYTEAPASLLPLLRQRHRWTRGMLQALRKRLRLLVARDVGIGTRLVIAYMLCDALVWPAMNVLANAFLLLVVAQSGATELLVLWWLQLALLDLTSVLFAIATEGEDIRLVPLSLLYRATYLLLIDVWKLPATLEEVAGLSMTWGKLDRIGLAPRR